MTSVQQEQNRYKKFNEADAILTDDKVIFERRATCLITAWRELRFCVINTHINDLRDLLHWAKRHTLKIVLSGDWGRHKEKFESKLISELKFCENLNASFAVHCKKLTKVIIDPWGHPTLNRLLSQKNLQVGDEEFAFFLGESGYLIAFRLKILCENRCEDLALNLVSAYMSCSLHSKSKRYDMNLTVDQKRYMLDIYISLLYKYNQTSVIVSTLKLLSLPEGLQLVKRFVKKRVDVLKLWKYSIRVTHLATVLFCSIGVMESLEKSESVIKSLLDVWLPLHVTENSLKQLTCSIRRIMRIAISASHMYIFCEALTSTLGSKMKTFTIELYIQALTTDLNVLERHKSDQNKELESETSKRLATAFMKLADVLSEHENVSRECVLTSFSLQPSPETLLKIEDIARQGGHEVVETGKWLCKLHPPISEHDEICLQCDKCGDFMGKLVLEAALNTNLTLNEALTTERLCISSQLCDDLAVILCSPRYQFLSWDQEWRHLQRLCAMYLYSPERTKNYVTELKYIDIDYNQFKNVKSEPVEETEMNDYISNCEELMAEEFKADQRLNQYHKDSRKPGRTKSPNEYYDVFVPPPKANTDPLVLKSLRSYRKTLKRACSDDLESSTSEKVFINSSPQGSCAQNSLNPSVNNLCTNVNIYEKFFINSISNLSEFIQFNDASKSNYQSSNSNTTNYQSVWNNENVIQNVPEYTMTETYDDSTNDYIAKFSFPALDSGNSLKKVVNKEDSNTNFLENVSEPLKPYLLTPKKFEILSKANVEPMEKVSCTEDKVPPWFENLPSNEIANENAKNHMQKENFCKRDGSFSVKDDKGGLTDNTKDLQNVKIHEVRTVNFSLERSPIQRKMDNKSRAKKLTAGINKITKKGTLKFTYNQRTGTFVKRKDLDNGELKTKDAQEETIVENKPVSMETSSDETNPTKRRMLSSTSQIVEAMIHNPPTLNKETIVTNKHVPIEKSLANNIQIPMEITVDNTPDQTTKQIGAKKPISKKKFTNNDLEFTIEPSITSANELFNTSYDFLTNNPSLKVVNFAFEREAGVLMEKVRVCRLNTFDCQFLTKEFLIQRKGEKPASKSVETISLVENEPVQKKDVIVENKQVPAKKAMINESEDDSIYDIIVPTSQRKINEIILGRHVLKKTMNRTKINRREYTISTVENVENSFAITSNMSPLEEIIVQLIEFDTTTEEEDVEAFEKEKQTKPAKISDFMEFERLHAASQTYFNNNPPETSDSDAEYSFLLCEASLPENSTLDEEYLKKKFKLKDLSIVVKRLNVNPPEEETPPKKRKTKPKAKVTEPKYARNKRKENKKRTSKKRSSWVSEMPPANKNKEEYKSSPLQDVNPRVLLKRIDSEPKWCPKKSPPSGAKDVEKMVPRVILKRLDMDKLKNINVNSVLENVPGLHDTEMIRPGNVDSVVQVVQVAGGRSTTTVPTNNQTSTQVSPHIQRIGQPRVDKPESNSETASGTKSSTASSISKPSSTQPSTLINILSQQARPTSSPNNPRPTRPPFINILSQQILRPATSPTKHSTSSTSTEAQLPPTSTRIVTSCEQQIINQLVSPVRSTGTLKTVVGTPVSDQSRIVQFICKSTDGKLIPVTSIATSRVVKVATTQTVTSSSPGSPNIDDNFTKLVNTSPKTKNDNSHENNAESLPKFQQAFGKTVYQNNVETNTNINSNINNTVELEKAKLSIKNSTSLNVQPIQGGVIYTRQMPVGQAINLIPQSRVFRIATSNPEQISLGKDSVIQNKMSALLAAALQGKQKNSEVSEVETNVDTNSISTNARVSVSSRSALIQNARIVKPVLQVPTNVIRNTQSSLSSTTLEQLREFDMVYKQVKERSSTSTTQESTVVPENSETSQRISVTYLNQGQKLNCAPVVVVSTYNNLQPAASPALSVASQGSSSPCVTPAPTPTPVLSKVPAKSSKGKSVKNATLHTTKASPIPKPQQKPQEDEHTTQRIFDILAEYAEQLRNSPDLNNKPAPRRRSNPPTNPSQNSKRKKSTGSKKTGQCTNNGTSDIDTEDPRTLGSEDSSCGVVQISMQDDEQTSVTANASESNDSNVQPRQQLILTESANNPTRNLIIADTSVGEALKMPNTAVLVPGNYIMPVSMVKGGQQIAVVSGGSKILATVPARSGPNMLLFQSFLNQSRKTNVSTVKYSTIQPISGISSQNLTGTSAQPPVILPSTSIGTVALGQPLTIKKMDDNERVNTELLLTIAQPPENSTCTDDTQQPDSSTNIIQNDVETVDLEENTTMSDNSSDKQYTFQKTLISTPIATPVIASCNKDDVPDEQTATSQSIMSLNLSNIEQNKGDTVKVEERVQSVLVAAGTSNGPMLSHSPPHYNKQSECSETTTDQYKDDFLHNGGKRINNEQKNLPNNNTFTQIKVKKMQATPQKDRELFQHQQTALERELRFQKSLSEECEDLGVDEPSTSDLFPEADLLFDSHSPSFDQCSQDILKRPIPCHGVKEESKLTLFSDDDFLFEHNDYQTTELEYVGNSHILTNGQNNATEESVSNCEDSTLLQTCTSMSDVTLNSPISPDGYNASTPPPTKFIHKYINRKKYDRTKQIEQWPVEISSSEDTTGSTELPKSRSPDMCSKRNDDDVDENTFKVVHVAMTKTECEDILCSNDTDALSGRGARKAVKKLCSCCNGSQNTTRKRPSSQPQSAYPNKKIFNKKR